MKLVRFIALSSLFILMINPAHAYRQSRVFQAPAPNCGFFQPCMNTAKQFYPTPLFSMPFIRPTVPVHGFISYRRDVGTQIVAHPSGCPHRQFCGCGSAVHVFGHSVRNLWLAANWLKFPRAMPAPGMAAVRRHHVFVLERHIQGNTWEAYDPNSGHHMTRIHAKSISGYRIVNPHI